MIIKIQGTVPATAEHADITPIDDYTGFVSFRKPGGAPICKGGARLRIFYDVIEGKYPDIDKVLPSGKTKKVDSIGVNAGYMGVIAKACKALGQRIEQVRLSFRGEDKVIEVHILNRKDVKIALMPCRL